MNKYRMYNRLCVLGFAKLELYLMILPIPKLNLLRVKFLAADAEEGQATVAAGLASASGVQLDSAGSAGDSGGAKVSTGDSGGEEPVATAATAGTVSCQRWTPAGCSLVAGEVSGYYHAVR